MTRWFLLFFALALPVCAGEETFYLGTFTQPPNDSEGIYIGTLDTETGKLGPLRLAAKETDPGFLALSPDPHFVFAALNGAVASLAVEPDGTLREISRQPSGGTDTCHVSLDRTGRVVFVANYGSGSVAAFPVGTDGRIGPRSAFDVFTGSGPNPERQKVPHAHSIYADPENRFVYACDLGTDKIWIFRLGANGTLAQAHPAFAQVPPGGGPRHLAFDGRFVYVVNEMGATTSVFQRNEQTGALQLLGTIGNIPGGAKSGSTSAELALHPSGRWLYVSTRGQEAISVFRINREGDPAKQRLKLIQNISSPAAFPRSFGVDPSGRWMIVAGQKGNEIAVVKIDGLSGRLTATPETAKIGSPVCVLFLPLVGAR